MEAPHFITTLNYVRFKEHFAALRYFALYLYSVTASVSDKKWPLLRRRRNYTAKKGTGFLAYELDKTISTGSVAHTALLLASSCSSASSPRRPLLKAAKLGDLMSFFIFTLPLVFPN